MDIFMPIPTSYTAPRAQTRQDGRTGRDDEARMDMKDKQQRQATGKQGSTGRRRAFSAQPKKSRARSRSRSRTRARRHGASGSRAGDGNGADVVTGEDEMINGSIKTMDDGAGERIGIEAEIETGMETTGRTGESILAAGPEDVAPLIRLRKVVKRQQQPQLAEGPQDQIWGICGSPSRVGPPATPPKSMTPFVVVVDHGTSPSTSSRPRTKTSRVTTSGTATTPVSASASACASTSTSTSASAPLLRGGIIRINKSLPTLPIDARSDHTTPSTRSAAIEFDPAPETDPDRDETTLTATSDRRATDGSAAIPSASAIKVASGRSSAPSPSSSSSLPPRPVSNGPSPDVNTPRIQLPAESTLPTGPGPRVSPGGPGAGAGASILPARTIHRHPSKHHAAMVPDHSQSSFSTRSASTSAAFRRTGSVSSPSLPNPGTNPSPRTGIMTSSEHLPPSSLEGSMSASNISTTSNLVQINTAVGPKPLIIRNGRTYIHDEQLPYPLPVDLAELHRQSLRTLLLFQLFGGPIISTAFSTKPPQRVLEVGCGSGFWSMMCHRYFAKHGHSGISFTGIDIVPLCGTGPDPNSRPDKDMSWRFIQHDMRRAPWPFQDGEFDLVMVKDMSSTAPGQFSQVFMDEYLRILRPGGVLEIWETDMSMRMLRPHVPAGPAVAAVAAAAAAAAAASAAEDSESESEDEDDSTRLGVYVVSANTPLSAPLNQFLVEYNGWLSKALDKRYLSAVPCTMIGPMLLQEDSLIEVRSKRLAVPLSEVRWEREGVGGVVTKDGKSYIDSMKGKGKVTDPRASKGGKSLTAVQAAIRRTALETSVGLIQALEPMLRDVSGKSQDEWDGWTGKMMNDLLKDGGTSWGECLEIGAWSARRTK